MPKKPGTPEWSQAEVLLLTQHYPTATWQELRDLLPNRPHRGIMAKASTLGLNRDRTYTEQEIASLTRLWPRGSIEQIKAALPTRTWRAISRMASILKLECEIERNRFGTLEPLLGDGLEVYYWAGFIAADGYLNFKQNQLVVMLSRDDKDHLEKLARFLQTNVRDLYSDGVKLLPMSRVAVADVESFPRFVQKFGFVSQKTSNPPDLPRMTPEQFVAFTGGFIDGDGSIMVRTMPNGTNLYSLRVECHASWLHILKQMEAAIGNFSGLPSRRLTAKVNSTGYAMFTLGGFTPLSLFKQSLYNIKLPLMERKWGKLQPKEV